MINPKDYSSFLSRHPFDFVPRAEKQKQDNYSAFYEEDMVKLPFYRNDENQVVLALYYPMAQSVSVIIQRKPVVLKKDGDYYTCILDLNDGIYPLNVIVDGNAVIDPFLPIGYGHNQTYNYIHLLSRDSDFSEKDVNHGSLVSYTVFNSVTMRNDRLFVYVPYEYRKDQSYDVLFLQHGFGENEIAWISQGRINLLCDNLIAENRIKPLLVVMADGMLYKKEEGEIRLLTYRFKDYLFDDLLPFVGKHYNIKDLYIAGLSMGSMQASVTALENPGVFKGVGLFSGFMSDLMSGYKAHLLPDKIKALCENGFLMRCIGDEDRFLPLFEKEDLLLKDVNHVRKIYHGEHEWNVWRQAIVDFLLLRENVYE